MREEPNRELYLDEDSGISGPRYLQMIHLMKGEEKNKWKDYKNLKINTKDKIIEKKKKDEQKRSTIERFTKK